MGTALSAIGLRGKDSGCPDCPRCSNAKGSARPTKATTHSTARRFSMESVAETVKNLVPLVSKKSNAHNIDAT